MTIPGFALSPLLTPTQQMLWCLYLASAVMLPMYHVRPIFKYLRGSNGIGDGCIRSETLQCCWRLPALLFSIYVVASFPLFLSVALDMTGRMVRIWAMDDARRRFEAKALADQHHRSSARSPMPTAQCPARV